MASTYAIWALAADGKSYTLCDNTIASADYALIFAKHYSTARSFSGFSEFAVTHAGKIVAVFWNGAQVAS